MMQFTDTTILVSASTYEFISAVNRAKEALAEFAAAILADKLKRLIAWNLAWELGTSPSRRYIRAGRPYGHGVKGKKKWLREMRTISKDAIGRSAVGTVKELR